MNARERFETLPAPNEIKASGYRVVYEHIQNLIASDEYVDKLIASGVGHGAVDPRHVEDSLIDLLGWAEEVLRRWRGDASDASRYPAEPPARKVWVLIVEHEYGVYVWASSTRERAEAKLFEHVKASWDSKEPLPRKPKEAIDRYFHEERGGREAYRLIDTEVLP